jgi:long-chain acyl-CoA synthetase
MSNETPPDPAKLYYSHPWLKQYPDFLPAEVSPPFENALEMFLHTAREKPEMPALYYFERVISYGELERNSSALAVAFRARGILPGDRVALYLQNIPQFLIALYAIWKCGAIVVLCSPMFKQRELEYHLNDSGARGLVCLESLYESVAADTLPRTGVQLVVTTNEIDYLENGERPELLKSSVKKHFENILDLMELVEAYAGEQPDIPTLKGSDIAFLTYTSGTTGQPKGAMNTHTNVVFNAEVYRVLVRLDEQDVVVGVAPFFHITGLVGHLAVAALLGAPIITFYRFDPGEMLRLVERWRGSFSVAAITVYTALMNHPAIGQYDISSLKKLYSGGAPVSPALVEKFEKLTGAYIHNIYGLTETTSPSHGTPYGLRAPVDPDTGALSVGLPLPGNICRVVDTAAGADLPAGQIGELLTKGPEIVAGYWNKPTESAAAIRDGFLYTGDVAKMDENGWFYLVDRKKDIIIASGYKVWPREVEDVLYQHPAVREAAVVGVPDEYRGETVKAYVALKSGYEGQVSAQELIDFCKARMASYKYPRLLEFRDELPKTVTGKYLRRELRDRP